MRKHSVFEPVALPYIDEMPKYRRIALAEFVAAAVEACFSRPGAEEEYQRWLTKKNEKEKLKNEQ